MSSNSWTRSLLWAVALGLCVWSSGGYRVTAAPAGTPTRWISRWSWSVALGGPQYGGTKTFIEVLNPSDPNDPKSPTATVDVAFYNNSCITGSLFSEGGGSQDVEPGGVAGFFVYPEPASGVGGGCLLVESSAPIVPSADIVSFTNNPVTGQSDSQVYHLDFVQVNWK